jgi:mannosylglycerate hydrolase
VVATPAAEESDPTAGYRFSVVPHTHWDREWYLPFEVFRMRLVRTVDRILDVLESDERFSHYTLDGQAVILEDYLELRPEHEGRLRRQIERGRLSVGPSYMLPDEFLAGQESLVRNLLVGRAVCRRFGVEPMAVGYMPDPFGHVAQLPQILRGFGLGEFIFWRGLGDEIDRLGVAFEWRAPDGTSVTAIRQLGSYGNANELGRWARDGVALHDQPWLWPETAAYRFVRFMERHGAEIERTGSPELFLCNGSDHEGIQTDLPDLLDVARAAHPDAQIRISSYPEYVERLRPWLRDLPMVQGELVGGREAPVLRGINSARIELKQAQEAAERRLLVAETLASLAVLAHGMTHPHAELERAWKQLLQNLPHDSISGCSVDEVHIDMAQRFRNVERIAERVRRESLAALAGTDEPWSYSPLPAASRSVLNARPHARTGVVAVPLPRELAGMRAVQARWTDGTTTPVQADRVGNDPVALVGRRLDGFAGDTLTLTAGAAELPEGTGARVVDQRTIENERYRVEMADDGTCVVTDRRTGHSHPGLHLLEDVADVGDEYNFSPVPDDRPLTTAGTQGRVRIRRRGPVVAELEWRGSLRLPESVTPDRRARSRRTVGCALVVCVRLAAGVERVEFRTELDNAARDHRLRVRFAAPAARASEPVRVEGHYAVLRRATRPGPGHGWMEQPARTHHTLGAVSAGDLAVFGRGLPEYEAVPTDDGGIELALTLLRAVGWLSRDDLATRPGHAGPELATPGAQGIGRHAYEYAIALGAADWSNADLLRASADFRFPLELGPAGATAEGVLSVGEGLAFAALKGAEDGDGVVLRVFNPDAAAVEQPVEARAGRIEPVRLDESSLPEEPASQRVAGGRIRSLRLVR